MGRKKVSELSADELQAQRKYIREKAAERRAKRDQPEQDNRGYRDRAEYMREYRKRMKSKQK